jgi:hypothetical protein
MIFPICVAPAKLCCSLRVVNPEKKAFQPHWRTDIYAAWQRRRAGAVPERAVRRHIT